MTSPSAFQALRRWKVAAAIIEHEGALLLVQNRRRNGSLDWSTPGGVVEPGEAVLEGLTREVLEETGVVVHEWDQLVYTVETIAVEMGWHLEVEVHRASTWSGEITIDDPDGIVEEARFVAVEEAVQLLGGSSPWVSEPMLSWLEDRWSQTRAYQFRLTGTDRATATVARIGSPNGSGVD